MLVSKHYSTFSGRLVVGLGARRHVTPYQVREDNLDVPPKHFHSSDRSSLLACLTKHSREHATVTTGRSHIIPFNMGKGSHIRMPFWHPTHRQISISCLYCLPLQLFLSSISLVLLGCVHIPCHFLRKPQM